MTFEEFQNSRVYVTGLTDGIAQDDISVYCYAGTDGDARADETPCGSLHIADMRDGNYQLIIGNAEYVTEDLAQLERILFKFAQDEGFA